MMKAMRTAYHSRQEIEVDQAEMWLFDWKRLAEMFGMKAMAQALNDLRLSSKFFPLPADIKAQLEINKIAEDKRKELLASSGSKWRSCGDCTIDGWVMEKRKVYLYDHWGYHMVAVRCQCFKNFMHAMGKEVDPEVKRNYILQQNDRWKKDEQEHSDKYVSTAAFEEKVAALNAKMHIAGKKKQEKVKPVREKVKSA